MICSVFCNPHLGGSLNARGIRDFQKRQTFFNMDQKAYIAFL